MSVGWCSRLCARPRNHECTLGLVRTTLQFIALTDMWLGGTGRFGTKKR